MPKKLKTTKAIGDSLEKLVSSYYEALGYRVISNINLEGHQIDLLVSKYVSGASLFTLMVEVKSRKSGAIGVNDVTPFLNTATALIISGQIQGAVLVTDSYFSQDANTKVLPDRGIRFATIKDLENDLFNYSESLLKLKYDYETSKIASEYISLSGEHRDRQKKIPDIAKYILRWAKEQESLLILSGDFGSGKTTLMERVRYLQALERLSSEKALYPAFFRLRNLLHFPDLWTFIVSSLRDNNYITPTQKGFEAELAAGKMLILLDGFDEIDTGATARDRASHLKRLAPLLMSASPCVLSTRPTYFESFEEMASVFRSSLTRSPAFARLDSVRLSVENIMERIDLKVDERLPQSTLRNVVVLSQLSERKIIDYLSVFREDIKRVTGASVTAVRDFLFRVYDLEDLMKRPLLLNMIVETVVAGLIKVTEEGANIGPSTLYDMYTQFCARRDVQNRPIEQFLTEGERLDACR